MRRRRGAAIVAGMIVLFTDFGLPYSGQMRAVIERLAPGTPVVELFTDAPAFDIQAAAYLLPAYAGEFPAGSVFLCVVDPGVGGARAAMALKADGRWFVGPDNGLFALVARRAAEAAAWEISWRPKALSASFHGRDLFAPVAARLAKGEAPRGPARDPAAGPGGDWPDDLTRVIYIDCFGNAMTGIRAASLPDEAVLSLAERRIARARTFSEVPPGEAFWYENANGLAEVAVNQGRAEELLGLSVGSDVSLG